MIGINVNVIVFRAAIWRFKEENRALMRRMYGDMESTSVYRQMRSSLTGEAQPVYKPKVDEKTTSNLMPSLFSSLEYNIRLGSGFATVQSAKEPVSTRYIRFELFFVKRQFNALKRETSFLAQGVVRSARWRHFSILMGYQLWGVIEATFRARRLP